MTVQLRDYQINLRDAVRDQYRAGRRAVLLQLATGGGKTMLTSEGVVRAAAERGHRVLVLVHRQELLSQFSASLTLCNIPHGRVAPREPMTAHRVQVASVQTVVRRFARMMPPTLIVIDEAHHAVAGSWRKVLNQWPTAHVLGLTATPQRLDGKGLGHQHGGVFDALVCGPHTSELIAAGHLAKPKVYASQRHLDRALLTTRAGEYATDAAADAMMQREIVGDAVTQYRKHCNGKRAIAFCCTLDHAEAQAHAFRAAGIPAERIDGSFTDADRAAVLERLRTGTTKVVTSVDLVSEGFDLPAVDAAILLRPTKSLSLFLQQVGRALRPAPGKPHAVILDHVGNALAHGLPDENREWSLAGRVRREAEGPRAKRCECCYAVAPASARACPECGTPFTSDSADGRGRRAPDSVEGELVELTPEMRARLQRVRRDEERAACRSGLAALLELARRRGYASPEGWANRRMAAYQATLRRYRGG